MGYQGKLLNNGYMKVRKPDPVLPVITITAPVASSVNQMYPFVTIEFSVVNPIGSYKISYSTDSGGTWTTITTTALFTYDWVPPDSLANWTTIQIKVESVKYPAMFSTVEFDVWGLLADGFGASNTISTGYTDTETTSSFGLTNTIT